MIFGSNLAGSLFCIVAIQLCGVVNKASLLYLRNYKIPLRFLREGFIFLSFLS